MSKFGKLVQENPVKFVGVVEAFLAVVTVALVAAGVTVPAGVVGAFLAFLALALSWWTQDNKTVPEFRAAEYVGDGVDLSNVDFSAIDLSELTK